MNENKFNSKKSIDDQPHLFDINHKKKLSKRNLIILSVSILVILFIIFTNTILQLLGLVLLIACIGVVLVKTGKYIIAISYSLVNIVLSIVAAILAIGAIAWVLSLL